MDISLLNVRVMIQKNSVTTDRYGNHRDAWEDYFACYATVSGETGQEQAITGGTVENTDMDVTVRWCRETAAVRSTKFRLVFMGEIYDILAIDHLRFKRHGLKFRCRKVRR